MAMKSIELILDESLVKTKKLCFWKNGVQFSLVCCF